MVTLLSVEWCVSWLKHSFSSSSSSSDYCSTSTCFEYRRLFNYPRTVSHDNSQKHSLLLFNFPSGEEDLSFGPIDFPQPQNWISKENVRITCVFAEMGHFLNSFSSPHLIWFELNIRTVFLLLSFGYFANQPRCGCYYRLFVQIWSEC